MSLALVPPPTDSARQQIIRNIISVIDCLQLGEDVLKILIRKHFKAGEIREILKHLEDGAEDSAES